MNISSLAASLPRELGSLARPHSADPMGPGGAAGAGLASPETKSANFSNVLQDAIGGVDAKLQAAGTEQTKVLTGETNNLHQAVIAMQEAGVAFSLMVEVRNKLVESYQELMRMQV
jgi:flagellar hook-basal body complex protein FliE